MHGYISQINLTDDFIHLPRKLGDLHLKVYPKVNKIITYYVHDGSYMEIHEKTPQEI